MISRFRYLIWITWRRILHRPVLSILIALVIIFLGAALIVMAYEKNGFGPAALKVFPAFFGELGEVQSPYLAVQISIIIGILVSISFIAIITAKITSMLIEFVRRGGTMAKKVNFSDHTIVCGWNFQGARIIRELMSANVKQERGIVILADIESRPSVDDRVEFIKGDPSQNESLIRAGVLRAYSVIVLTDFTKGANAADAQALMIVLAVESLNRKVHTCVQLMSSANRIHLENAHADEIICLDQMGGSLVVASAINPGVASLVADLLSFNKGSEFYRYDKPLSGALVGKEFTEAVQLLAQRKMILLGFETDYSEELQQQLSGDVINKLPEADRAVIVNPQSIYKIRQGDALFIIAESEPTQL
jgi:voltage-gated potassium channel